jgi:hypothetical protein
MRFLRGGVSLWLDSEENHLALGSFCSCVGMCSEVGGWLNTADNHLGPVADFDGDGRAEILVTSPWGRSGHLLP